MAVGSRRKAGARASVPQRRRGTCNAPPLALDRRSGGSLYRNALSCVMDAHRRLVERGRRTPDGEPAGIDGSYVGLLSADRHFAGWEEARDGFSGKGKQAVRVGARSGCARTPPPGTNHFGGVAVLVSRQRLHWIHLGKHFVASPSVRRTSSEALGRNRERIRDMGRGR